MSEQSRDFTGLSLLLSVTLVLLVAACMCIMPGPASENASASPGAGWEEQTPIADGEDLNAITAVGSEVAWAAGGEMIMHTEDGGATWSEQTANTKVYNILAMDAVDEQRVWAVWLLVNMGYDGVWQTANGGDTWIRTFINIPPPRVNAYLYDVAVVDTGNIWAVGGGAQVIIKTSNGGWNWDLQYYATSSAYYLESFQGISAVDADTAWVVGDFATIMRTTDGGATWEHCADTGAYGYREVAAVDGETAWVVSAAGDICKTTDGGATWELQGEGVASGLNAISAVDENTVWAVGTPLGASEESVIVKTTDGGATWVPQDSGVEAPLSDIVAIDAATAWAVGKDGVIVKTTDGGDDAPDILSVSPISGTEGDAVTITGCDFGAVQDSSYVSFGGVQATAYTSWSDTEIVVDVPAGASGTVPVTVTTSEGTSNPVDFTAYAPLTLTSVTPDQAAQNAIAVEISDLAGTGFKPGATVRFEQGGVVLEAYDVNVVSAESITCKIGFFLKPTGTYDVVVTNPDASEARLEGGFTVNPACGEGSGIALLMLGLTLGLLSLAGSSGIRRMRKRRRE